MDLSCVVVKRGHSEVNGESYPGETGKIGLQERYLGNQGITGIGCRSVLSRASCQLTRGIRRPLPLNSQHRTLA